MYSPTVALTDGFKVAVPHFQQDPCDDGFIQNPYPFYDRVRAAGPLFYWREYGLICASDYATVNSLLRDRRFGREAPANARKPHLEHLSNFYALEENSMLELEPPRHTRLRGQVLRAFTSRRILALEPEIEALCTELIDQFPNGPFDLLTTYAERIPVIIIARLLGVPDAMADQLLAWSHDIVAMYQARKDRGIEDAAERATLEFSAYVRGLIAERRENPRDDLISELAKSDPEKISDDELIATCILLLNAGHEATVHAIGNSVAVLLDKGVPLAPLFDGPETTLATVEELIRFDPPLHMFTRYALEDITLHGQTFKTGDQIGLLLASANRDPAKFAHPAEFDPERGGLGEVSFGAGLHFCIGAPLARLEMATGLQYLFARCPNIRLSETPRYANRYHFHGLERLMVTV